RASATSSSSGMSCSDTDRLEDFAGIDRLQALPRLAERDLAFGRVLLGHAEIRGHAELVRDRSDPTDEPLDALARRQDLAPIEIDEGLGEPVADRPPEVLLDHVVR